MRNFRSLLLAAALAAGSSGGVARAQNGPDAISVEDFKRLQAEVVQLTDAYADQAKRINALNRENEALQNQLRDAQDNQSKSLAAYATRDELRKMADKIQEVDQKRLNDNKHVLSTLDAIQAQIEKLAKAPAPAPAAAVPKHGKEKDPDTQRDGKEKTGTGSKSAAGSAAETENFYSYKVGKGGETLGTIIGAYNAEFKKEGKKTITLDQVRKANPKLNINSIRVGQEILIPIPPDKEK